MPVTVTPDLGPQVTAGRFALVPQGTAILTVTEPTAGDRLWVFGPALLIAAVIAAAGALLWRVARSLRTARRQSSCAGARRCAPTSTAWCDGPGRRRAVHRSPGGLPPRPTAH
ncbi:hypothetical protein [Micromonospora nigra]|uniref:hypothetical protein n=1 Tax=Micromonospora nigra TaxID=145857 RepID=UPI001112D65F|nr:hypothetical protein [Micromonospora nigra]